MLHRIAVASFSCFLFPATLLAADVTVTGSVDKQGGGPIIYGAVELLTPNEPYDVLHHVNLDATSGQYSIPAVPEGNYKIAVIPQVPSDDQFYQPIVQDVYISPSATQFDYTLSPGGIISGAITKERADKPWENIIVSVYDNSRNFVTWGRVISPGQYMTMAVAPGDYTVRFDDTEYDYTRVWYGGYPEWQVEWGDADPVPVEVTANTITEDIDIDLYDNTQEHYYISWTGLGTTHDLNPRRTATWASADIEIVNFDDAMPIMRDVVTSMVVTTPSGATCTNSGKYADIVWRWQLRDRNRNGVIDDGPTEADNEWVEPEARAWAGRYCDFASTPHDGGKYTITTTFEDNTVITREFDVPAGLAISELPPVTNLTAAWQDASESLALSWDADSTKYASNANKLEIRVNTFKNGHYQNAQLRIRDLPVHLTSFTLNKTMTNMFNSDFVDQIKIQIRVYGDNDTVARTSKSYTFDSASGTLTEAPIRMSLLDIDGDGRTGLQEAIHALRVTSDL